MSDFQKIESLEAVKAEIKALESIMLEKRPEQGEALAKIHATLQTYPENVTLLSEAEIGVIIRGLTTQSGIELVKKAAKTATSKTSIKSLANRLDEL